MNGTIKESKNNHGDVPTKNGGYGKSTTLRDSRGHDGRLNFVTHDDGTSTIDLGFTDKNNSKRSFCLGYSLSLSLSLSKYYSTEYTRTSDRSVFEQVT